MTTPHTETVAIAKNLGIPRVYAKREDLHPYGSHKGRSIPSMIDSYVGEGKKRFALSSSGNAALSAALHVTKLNAAGAGLSLDIFVGRGIPAEKLAPLRKLEGDSIKIRTIPRPLQALFAAVSGGATSLRQSTDDRALSGYRSLADELVLIPDLEAVFVATSSGTTIQALSERFAELGKNMRLFAVQTPSCHPFAEGFDEDRTDETSIAGAIVDKVAHRRDAVSRAIRQSGGSVCIARNALVEKARLMLKADGIIATANGALSLAGVLRARELGFSFARTVAIVISGK